MLRATYPTSSAIALDLAVRHLEASGLIMQSTFTSMADTIQHQRFLEIFPIRLFLTERFDLLSKISSLRIPVLLLHGTVDSVVPFEMSQRLYNAASEPKQLFFISGADHVRIYQPGEKSYLKAIQRFIDSDRFRQLDSLSKRDFSRLTNSVIF